MFGRKGPAKDRAMALTLDGHRFSCEEQVPQMIASIVGSSQNTWGILIPNIMGIFHGDILGDITRETVKPLEMEQFENGGSQESIFWVLRWWLDTPSIFGRFTIPRPT